MPRTLEDRQRAIAEALRAIMAEPVWAGGGEATRFLSLPLASLRKTAAPQSLASPQSLVSHPARVSHQTLASHSRVRAVQAGSAPSPTSTPDDPTVYPVELLPSTPQGPLSVPGAPDVRNDLGCDVAVAPSREVALLTPPPVAASVDARASVPPLEKFGAMSRAASRALFGDD